jgi:hypothetical protein
VENAQILSIVWELALSMGLIVLLMRLIAVVMVMLLLICVSDVFLPETFFPFVRYEFYPYPLGVLVLLLLVHILLWIVLYLCSHLLLIL